MPKIQGKVLEIGNESGMFFAKIQMNRKVPRVGDNVIVKWGSTRTLNQNALLWVYYTWLIEHAGMKDHGFFCVDALHSSLKAHFLAEKIMSRGEFKAIEEGSTATLNKLEFGQYVEKIDMFIVDFFKVDTSSFWSDYEKYWKM